MSTELGQFKTGFGKLFQTVIQGPEIDNKPLSKKQRRIFVLLFLSIVAEPELFVFAPAPTSNKLRLRLLLQLVPVDTTFNSIVETVLTTFGKYTDFK
jgi:hypothetical protein